MQSKEGSGQRAHGGHGGHGLSRGQLVLVGQAGQTGGTIWDFKMYKCSSPLGIWDLGIPLGLASFAAFFCFFVSAGEELAIPSTTLLHNIPKISDIKTIKKRDK